MSDASIYLDHQATTALAPGVLDEMNHYFSDSYGNPHSSDHAFGWRSSDAIERARFDIASAIDADPDELIFTSGATEANNIAILGFDRDRELRVVTSTIEHKSVIAAARERARYGSTVTYLQVDRHGGVDLDQLVTLLRAGTDVVSIMAVNNEIGTAQPIDVIGALCRDHGAALHVDAAQALPFDARRLWAQSADLISLSSHKIGGPAGIGVLHIKRWIRDRLQPIMFGGGQEDGLRPGTLPTPLCAGFAAACRVLPPPSETEAWRTRTEALAALLAKLIPGSLRNGGGPGSHPGNISLTLPGGDAGALIARLQPLIALATGSACTSGVPEPSHVLRAIGLDAESCERTVRISVGRFTTPDEIRAAAEEIVRAYGAARA